MITILEALRELSLLYESAKTDFINKFGEDVLAKFDKARDRLKNNGYSVDYGQYLKKSKKEVEDLILSLYDKDKDAQKRRVLQGTDKEIRGKYKYLGEKDGYKVYQPLDALASMDLGVNTGWCTTGRYGHYGHPEYTPSYEDAKEHWDEYTHEGIQFYYFLNPKNMYGEYAIALYPEVLEDLKDMNFVFDAKIITDTNIEIYNAEDELDYSDVSKLPIELIPHEIILDYVDYSKSGEMIIENNIVKRYVGKGGHVVVPDNVTSIGTNAFNKCSGVTSITIPESVTRIDDFAFYNCSSLTSITIPNSVTTIGDSAFSGCSGLASVTIQDGVTSIGNWTFFNCGDLTSITIPDSVTSIGSSAFYGCPKLNCNIYDNGKYLGNTNNKYLALVRSTNNSITSCTINSNTRFIMGFAFSGCNGLTSVTIPNNVTSIGYNAFKYCDALETVEYDGTISSWNKIDMHGQPFSYRQQSYGIEFKCRDKDPNGGKIVLLSNGDLMSDATGELLE